MKTGYRHIILGNGKKIYFASDIHLGAPSYEESRRRELFFVDWLDTVKNDAGAVFLLGDIFDFWFEYKTVIPKGFVRLLGKMAEITDSGIPVYFFAGNHDMWMDGYFEKELNIPVFHKPEIFIINGKRFFIGHGDGLSKIPMLQTVPLGNASQKLHQSEVYRQLKGLDNRFLSFFVFDKFIGS